MRREDDYPHLFRLLEETDVDKQMAVREALAKFNFFLHLTAWLSGCSFLLILGILLPPALAYVFIPVGLWTCGLAYHGFRAFRPKSDRYGPRNRGGGPGG